MLDHGIGNAEKEVQEFGALMDHRSQAGNCSAMALSHIWVSTTPIWAKAGTLGI